ncbi:SDR family NAD(P)-dependent oxidoreductase [Undibacterium sp. TJN25]|uniref:SDR family NAD(P)-dependent oxidoreductase n=1 Tax=Undibacterium sp. TJN25 TaxID=3413056 RepID=UPI003BF126EB
MNLQGKNALITGGNSGIGLATARQFIAAGAKVAITGRNHATLDLAAQELGPNLSVFLLDITDVASIEAAVTAAASELGSIDILFANAGMAAMTPLATGTADEFSRIVATNLTSVFFTVQASLPYLNHGASVILNGSVHATQGVPGWSAYAATKGGVRSMTRVLAAELAPKGIRVNQVTPGATRTPIWDAVAPDPRAMEALELKLRNKIPLGRLGEADEVAATVLFLASAASANITAQEIVVDGGATGAPLGAPVYLV